MRAAVTVTVIVTVAATGIATVSVTHLIQIFIFINTEAVPNKLEVCG